jgi:hypothetical protein
MADTPAIRKCETCSRELQHIKGITVINPAGNEESFCYYYCENDNVYYVEVFEDPFLADSVFTSFQKIDSDKAKSDIKLINTCPDNQNKFCNCPVHRSAHRFG